MTQISATENIPTRLSSAVFRGKSTLLQTRRFVFDLLDPDVRAHSRGELLVASPVLASSRTKLLTEVDPRERTLTAGKIQNLRIAIRRLNGIEVPAGSIFSFWKQIGRATRFNGFVEGREIREGCVVPSIGGGLCQLSNALYDAALNAEFEILERHAHTRVLPGSLAELDRDATVFWNYVDLRFRSGIRFRIEANMDASDLTVIFRGEGSSPKPLHTIRRKAAASPGPNSCATCETGSCHRVIPSKDQPELSRSVFLVDEFSREFQNYVDHSQKVGDRLMLPLDGERFRKPNYAWRTNGFDTVQQSLLVAIERSIRSRRLAHQGAARQRSLLSMYDKLAASYAAKLRFSDLHLVIQQSLLPFLWQDGVLGGRSFDVLMTALPMAQLQDRLDTAFRLHPQSRTLGDFRADPYLVTAESEALNSARHLITPHSAIAGLFPDRVKLLDWELPKASERRSPPNTIPRIVFPASTVARKGCFELREALRGLEVEVVLLGPVIETPDFWYGFRTVSGGPDWLDSADLVVLPAFIEHRPRSLLRAIASGIPVVATEACGVSNLSGVRSVPASNVDILRNSIIDTLNSLR